MDLFTSKSSRKRRSASADPVLERKRLSVSDESIEGPSRTEQRVGAEREEVQQERRRQEQEKEQEEEPEQLDELAELYELDELEELWDLWELEEEVSEENKKITYLAASEEVEEPTHSADKRNKETPRDLSAGRLVEELWQISEEPLDFSAPRVVQEHIKEAIQAHTGHQHEDDTEYEELRQFASAQETLDGDLNVEPGDCEEGAETVEIVTKLAGKMYDYAPQLGRNVLWSGHWTSGPVVMLSFMIPRRAPRTYANSPSSTSGATTSTDTHESDIRECPDSDVAVVDTADDVAVTTTELIDQGTAISTPIDTTGTGDDSTRSLPLVRSFSVVRENEEEENHPHLLHRRTQSPGPSTSRNVVVPFITIDDSSESIAPVVDSFDVASGTITEAVDELQRPRLLQRRSQAPSPSPPQDILPPIITSDDDSDEDGNEQPDTGDADCERTKLETIVIEDGEDDHGVDEPPRLLLFQSSHVFSSSRLLRPPSPVATTSRDYVDADVVTLDDSSASDDDDGAEDGREAKRISANARRRYTLGTGSRVCGKCRVHDTLSTSRHQGCEYRDCVCSKGCDKVQAKRERAMRENNIKKEKKKRKGEEAVRSGSGKNDPSEERPPCPDNEE